VEACDVTSKLQVEAMLRRVIKELGQVDILVDNTGAVTMAPAAKLEATGWDYVMRLTTSGVLLCAKNVISVMPGQRFGRIITISSTSGLKA
jgi:NAD(P)-dependent dehydrogenase (short-subunit alcohol dehydrogenase family)